MLRFRLKEKHLGIRLDLFLTGIVPFLDPLSGFPRHILIFFRRKSSKGNSFHHILPFSASPGLHQRRKNVFQSFHTRAVHIRSPGLITQIQQRIHLLIQCLRHITAICQNPLHHRVIIPLFLCLYLQKILCLFQPVQGKRLAHGTVIHRKDHILQPLIVFIKKIHGSQFHKIRLFLFIFLFQKIFQHILFQHFQFRFVTLAVRRIQADAVEIIFDDKTTETVNSTYMGLGNQH